MIQDYQRQVNGRPLWLRSKQLRIYCEQLHDVARNTIQLLTNRKHDGGSSQRALASKLEESIDRANFLRGMEYGLVPKRRSLERKHVKLICRAQQRVTPIKLADRAAASSGQCILLAQIMARHDAKQAKFGSDDE